MKKAGLLLMVFLVLICGRVYGQDDPVVYIKDIAGLEGARDNHLVGYGIVVGLDGTGDSSRSQPTMQSITNMLARFGVDVPEGSLRLRNAAAVMVTATLPPFTYPGERIDVLVSSLGDARSLAGGVLLLSPLRAGDGEIYAVAQGSISLGGINTGRNARESIQHNTTALIPGGALVEVEVDYAWYDEHEIKLRLRDASFATSSRLAQAINDALPVEEGVGEPAVALDAGRVLVKIPDYAREHPVDFVAAIYNLQVEVDMPAKVVINERTGTVVMGHGVKISTVAVAHEGLRISIGDEIVDRDPLDLFATTQYDYEERNVAMMESGATVLDLVRGLNAIGAKPADIIAILLAIEKTGALHAVLEVI